MMKSSAVALTLAVIAVTHASAACGQTLRGALTERSKAAIRISVSVAPVFHHEVRLGRSGAAETLQFKSTTPSLRYHVVAYSPGHDEAFAPAAIADLASIRLEAVRLTNMRSNGLESEASKSSTRPDAFTLVLVVPD